MKHPPQHQPMPPREGFAKRLFASSAALIICAMTIPSQAQTTGTTNVPKKKIIYELQPIIAAPADGSMLPISLSTSILNIDEIEGQPTRGPKDKEISWTADRGGPVFLSQSKPSSQSSTSTENDTPPNRGSAVKLDFLQPFVKQSEPEDRKVQVTATYIPSQEEETSAGSTEGTNTDAYSLPPAVKESPREEEVSLTYLDFWIAGSEESDDDVLIVRPTTAQSSDQDKKVIHWAKVVVKHSVPGELPLLLQSAGSQPVYFYGEQNDPNQLSEEPELKEVLEQPYAKDQYFWVGTDAKGEGTATIQAQGNLGTGYKNAPEQKTLKLVPVDLDIVHPVTGELNDAKEDIDDGGYVSVQRLEDPSDLTSDATPKTKLKIHAISGAQFTWKTRLKFNGADRFKIYRDEARTQEITSEQTEFDATKDTNLFFQGLKKSISRGGELVTMQVKVNDVWVDGDSVKCTIVQSEFLIQVKAFIPYAWTEAEEEVPGPDGMSPMVGKVAKGDLHPGLGDRVTIPGFLNVYSTDKELPPGPVATGSSTVGLYKYAPFRCCQTIILTPYQELHQSYDLESKRMHMTAPSSDHYTKATSVNAAEITLKKGYMALSGAPSSTGKGPIETKDYRQGARTGKIAELHIEFGGIDGALGFVGSSTVPYSLFAEDIHWDMWLKVNSESNPLLPNIEFGGEHDSYPAYEIIVIQSNGTFKPIHNVLPAAHALPGPDSLDEDNAISVGGTDTIRD
jgi:hypothetical protein